ncbi:hypothetical protein GCM10010260_30240 [Streptomyces filipinensis]|uniref:Uncharacterized protein n=1 Tax=Streptomyces filipinensis TaxID=66887 RepID=A0A918MBM8_9ACTN|nr:hypothetical protein GCM10010260_30240 [Streptomyces filipinensis]
MHYHHRPHEGLRHPLMPKKALTPTQMWAALVAVAGYMPVPLTGRDYLELLPVRWQAITPAGMTIHHRTYDHDLRDWSGHGAPRARGDGLYVNRACGDGPHPRRIVRWERFASHQAASSISGPSPWASLCLRGPAAAMEQLALEAPQERLGERIVIA